MAGITVQKNYVSSSLVSTNLANNWMVLVFGVTSRGPIAPTLVQTYANFEKQFGQPVKGVSTHPYVQLLLNSGVPVLFKRVTDNNKFAKYIFTANNTDFFKVSANSDYVGEAGKNIYLKFTTGTDSDVNKCYMNVYYSDKEVTANTKPSEQYFLGTKDSSAVPAIDFIDVLFNFVSIADKSFNSQYIDIQQLNFDAAAWKTGSTMITMNTNYQLAITDDNDSPQENDSYYSDRDAALAILMDYSSSFWTDKKLKNSAVYYPQLRFVTTGGLVTSGVEADKTTYHQNTINHNLGKFVVDCGLNFRALIDYSIDMIDIAVVRAFAASEAAGTTKIKNKAGNFSASDEPVSPSVYAYFGFWGSDVNNNWLPGSAGFLSALGLSGYDVYSRRIAGSAFTPAFAKPYEELYIDSINDWQNEEAVQVNPIVYVDVQDNLAIMGSSTLALPLSSISARNPAQALDIVLVGDYITNILHNIALGELESALDRLSLNSLSNRMSQEVEKFVTSRAITRYDFTFDTTQLGKLGINCTLYFAVGLEEVELTVTSVYDTTAIAAQ